MIEVPTKRMAAPVNNSLPHDFQRRTRLTLHRSAHWSRARTRATLGALTAAIALALLIAHGLKSSSFLVDTTSLGLLAFVSLPFLSLVVTSFKAAGVEFSFRELSVHDQVLTFLDGIALKKQWTFFNPRAGEERFGAAFVELTCELVKNAHGDLVPQLRVWLRSEHPNHRWFAAEIIGYHKLQELHRAVRTAPESRDPAETWETWELNCLWAASRFEQPRYRSLCSFLLATSSPENQAWILHALDQMIDAGEARANEFDEAVRTLEDRLRKNGATSEQIDCRFIGLTKLHQP
jgi:hypothetical protein